jgi:aryl-alcohol dehydrogenase-like predicted oxidoreductase
MALVPWNVLGAGRLRSDEEEKRREESGEGGRRTIVCPDWRRNEVEKKVSRALDKIARECGDGISVPAGKSLRRFSVDYVEITTHVILVAIAYVMHKAPYVFPVVGCRKVEHLHDNIKALSISLTPEQIEYLEGQVPFDPGFPHSMIVCVFYVPRFSLF